MTDRIKATFEHLASQGRKALIPYVTAGLPTPAKTVDVLDQMVEAGADIIEIGIPFSDPMADGPVIQQANDSALAQGMTMQGVFDLVKSFRKNDGRTPIVLMGYGNSVEAQGQAAFLNSCRSSGVDGLIIVDYPPEESADFAALARKSGISVIYLIAPTSPNKRVESAAQIATGYIYHVSLTGVTGAGHLNVDNVAEQVERIRQFVSLPVVVGFGIRDAESAKAIAASADGVVIGSRILQIIQQAGVDDAAQQVQAFIAEIRHALDELASPPGADA